MNKEPLIELSAIAGKIAVEHTKLPPFAKFFINFGIDMVAAWLEKELSSDIEKICDKAKRFDMERVIAIPLGTSDGKDLVAIRAYGKQAEAFIKDIGMQVISENSPNSILNDIHEKEKRFGIVIYEKKD